MCDKRDGCLIRFSLILIAVAPIASLKMGSTLNPKDIKEGSDVYFECNVRANPRSYKLTWFHEVGAASTVSFFFFFPFFFFLFFFKSRPAVVHPRRKLDVLRRAGETNIQ